MEEDTSPSDNVVTDYATYEDFLDSQITSLDLYYNFSPLIFNECVKKIFKNFFLENMLLKPVVYQKEVNKKHWQALVKL